MGFDRPADGSIEPRNAEHSEECEPLDSVQPDGHFEGVSFSFMGPRYHIGGQSGLIHFGWLRIRNLVPFADPFGDWIPNTKDGYEAM